MGEGLAVDLVHLDGSAVLMVRGEIDMATAASFSAAIEQSVSFGVPIVLDFGGVTFMDSSGLNVILDAQNPAGGPVSVSVRNPTPQIRRVFTTTGLSHIVVDDTGVITDPAEREPDAIGDGLEN